MISYVFGVVLMASLALAQNPGFGRCPKTKAVTEFDVEAYVGRWFEISAYPFFPTAASRCVESDLSLNENGTISILNKRIRLGREVVNEGTGRVIEDGVGVLHVNYTQLNSKLQSALNVCAELN